MATTTTAYQLIVYIDGVPAVEIPYKCNSIGQVKRRFLQSRGHDFCRLITVDIFDGSYCVAHGTVSAGTWVDSTRPRKQQLPIAGLTV